VPPVTSGARSLSWISRGACREADPELFFPVAAVTDPAARQAEAAKAVCGPCAVRANCLAYALEARPEGIWGGTTVDERSAARRRPSHRRANARRLAIHFVQGFDAADPQLASTQSIAEEWKGIGDIEEETQHRILEGHRAIIEHLRKSLDHKRVQIRLNTPISASAFSMYS